MKKVEIKCLVRNSINIYRYHVSIYDSNNNIILDEDTDKSGCVYFKPQNLKLYKVVVKPLNNVYPGIICQNVVFTNDNNKNIIFIFNKINIIKITIKFFAKNYSGLLIRKGEIKLWPNHIL